MEDQGLRHRITVIKCPAREVINHTDEDKSHLPLEKATRIKNFKND